MRTRGAEVLNWAGNQRCRPAERAEPSTVAEVVDLVQRARARGRTVKVIGAGHSFSPIAMTDGVLVSLDRLAQLESVDQAARRVTVQAGMRLGALNERLAGLGLAMPNLGDIAYQSIAGAISTATHGTGRELPNLSAQVVAMELVTGEGEVRWLDEGDPMLRFARVGLGALGIVTRVRLQCVPSFSLHVRETVERFDDVLARFDEESRANDHFELFFIPGAERCLVKRNNRTDRPPLARGPARHFLDKVVGENLAFEAACRIARRFPSTIPRLRSLVDQAMSDYEGVDRSDRVFASPRLVRFYETELAVPIDDLPEAVARVRDVAEGLEHPPLFPIELRVSKADDIPLSTAYGRDSGWIACHVYQGRPYEEYFRGVSDALADLGARPHWGKMHFLDRRALRPRYPEWDAFLDARDALDPDRVFDNPYLRRVLGGETGKHGSARA